MARKRKAARETTGQGVLPLYYTKSEFEELHKTVIAYAEAIRSRNRNANERELSKEEVTDQFIVAVFHEYAPTDSACFELLGQLESPAYHNYWAKLTREKNAPRSRQKVDGTTFWITARKLSPALVERYPDSITLENEDLGLVIAPGIALRSLDQISYRETLKSIFDANSEIDSLHVYERQLWVAIVSIIYHFEDAALRVSKLKEMSTPDVEVDNLGNIYRLPHQNPSSLVNPLPGLRLQTTPNSEPIAGITQDKGEKRDLEEEQAPTQENKGKGREDEEDYREEEVDAEDQTPSRKRQKRAAPEIGNWQDFGAELESAGATMSAFPISLDFADTDLPFRFKK